MTIQRELDHRLASYFEDSSVQAPPADLLARGLARVEATRQRPSWLVGGGGGRPALRLGRTVVPAWAALVMIALLAVAVVIVGSQLIRQQQHQTVVAPLQSLSIESNAVETPFETVAPTREPGIGTRPGMFATLRDIKAVSDTVAWFITESAIYRTDDTGQTWREVEPVGWTSQWSSAFVDADTAYASQGGSPATIVVTHDGGATWSGALHIYHTTDGGSTWSGPIAGAVPHMNESSDKLYPPIGGFLWQSAGKAPGVPYDNRFFLSVDGGANWSQYTFPISAISPKGALKSIRAIRREENGRLLVFLDASRNGPGALPPAIYESTDDPTTWQVLSTDAGDSDLKFLSDTAWLASSSAPSEVRTTVDRGTTWTTVSPSVSLYYTSRQWATLRTGWATQECRWLAGCTQDPDAIVVMVTTDGGATWTDIGQ
jgi:photosystem II stability/assembly factor-like uncharacterized protein